MHINLTYLFHTVLYLIGGAVTGITAGLLGIGGGLIIIPFLVFIFPYDGIPQNILMHMAVGTTLMITVFTSISSISAHKHRGGILMDVAKQMLLGLFLGAIIGAIIAGFLPSHILQIIFGAFAILIAFKLGLNFKPKPSHRLPGKAGLFGVATVISCACSILGLAGGTITVPYFIRCNMPMTNAVATSTVCTLPISLAGGVCYLILGLHTPNLPPLSIGYVFLPAFFGIAIMSMICAPMGAKLAHRLPADTLRRVFAVFLVIVGLDMLIP